MKRLLTLLSALSLLAGLSLPVFAAPAAPILTLETQGIYVRASWLPVAGASGYRLYYAPYPYAGVETISALEMGGETSLAVELWEGAAYYVAVKSLDAGGESDWSNIGLFILGPMVPPLNDTGIDWYANERENHLTSASPGYVGQDAQYGRDARAKTGTLVKVGGGSKGFDFTKIDANGNTLPNSATSWSCVRDNVTGLTWEIKTDDDGLRDKDNAYTWYNPDPAVNGGAAGMQNGGTCTGGISCDTAGYVAAVNAAGLCGTRDWRLPNRFELESIVDHGIAPPGPSIDVVWFPDMPATLFFWSGSPSAKHLEAAWYVYFQSGAVFDWYKSYVFNIRLVRGGQ